MTVVDYICEATPYARCSASPSRDFWANAWDI